MYSDDDRRRDAATVLGHVTGFDWQPRVWSDVGEIGIEWHGNGKHAFISIEGDGRYGYMMLKDGSFVAGDVPDPEVSFFPDDLRRYLNAGT